MSTSLMHITRQCTTHCSSSKLAAVSTSSMSPLMLQRLHRPHCCLSIAQTRSSRHSLHRMREGTHHANNASHASQVNAPLTIQVHILQLWAPLPSLCQCCGAFTSHIVVYQTHKHAAAPTPHASCERDTHLANNASHAYHKSLHHSPFKCTSCHCGQLSQASASAVAPSPPTWLPIKPHRHSLHCV